MAINTTYLMLMQAGGSPSEEVIADQINSLRFYLKINEPREEELSPRMQRKILEG